MSPQARERSLDELAIGLASGSISSGKAIRLMGAALVGGALGSVGIGEAEADNLCKPNGKKCKKNSQCCSGICSTNGTCAACPDGRVLLSKGTCAIICGEGSPTGFLDCPCGEASCTRRFPQPSTLSGICLGLDPGNSHLECTTDAVCPPGEFCAPSPFSDIGECVPT